MYLVDVSNQTNVYLVQIHSSLDNITNITWIFDPVFVLDVEKMNIPKNYFLLFCHHLFTLVVPNQHWHGV